MKTIAILAAGLTLAACTVAAPEERNQQGASAAASQPDIASLQRELETANAAYDRALIAGDAKVLAQVYTDDFQIIDDDGAIHDKQNQIDFMTTKVDLLTAKGEDVKVTMLGPDSALVTGRFAGRYRMDGKESDFAERYTSVWVRQHGTWRVRHEHTSLVPKEATASAT